MGNVDSVPLVSQLKSLVQVIGGDADGAKKTQENFSQGCPGRLRTFKPFLCKLSTDLAAVLKAVRPISECWCSRLANTLCSRGGRWRPGGCKTNATCLCGRARQLRGRTSCCWPYQRQCTLCNWGPRQGSAVHEGGITHHRCHGSRGCRLSGRYQDPSINLSQLSPHRSLSSQLPDMNHACYLLRKQLLRSPGSSHHGAM